MSRKDTDGGDNTVPEGMCREGKDGVYAVRDGRGVGMNAAPGLVAHTAAIDDMALHG